MPPIQNASVADELTQGEMLEDLTQPMKEDMPGEALIPLTEALETQFRQDESSVLYDGVVYEMSDGSTKKQPLAFFRAVGEHLTVTVGRGDKVDVRVPNSTGECGVSRFSFSLERSATGDFSLLSRNSVPFVIRSPQRTLRLAGAKLGEDPVAVPLYRDDRICFNNCSLYIHYGCSKDEAGSSLVDEMGLPRSTIYLLSEAVRGLTFIRDSAEPQILQSVLPSIVANLSGLLSQADEPVSSVDSASSFQSSGYENSRRRRRNNGRRGNRGRGRVRFR